MKSGTMQTCVPHQETQQGAGAGEGGEQAQQHADAQGRRKTLDQACAKKESRTANQRGQVTINDRGKRLGACIDRTNQSVSTPQLIFDPLKDQHVASSHTDRP